MTAPGRLLLSQVTALLLALGTPLRAGPGAGGEVPAPGSKDLCAVCGMFVHKYPDWVATLRFRDGQVFHFDGAKDLFKFLQDLPRFAPGKTAEAIQDLLVTEYYDVARIPAREAFFVVGSDVLGPMGDELVPFRTEEDATAFQQDHHGKRVLRFQEVTREVVEKVDQRLF